MSHCRWDLRGRGKMEERIGLLFYPTLSAGPNARVLVAVAVVAVCGFVSSIHPYTHPSTHPSLPPSFHPCVPPPPSCPPQHQCRPVLQHSTAHGFLAVARNHQLCFAFRTHRHTGLAMWLSLSSVLRGNVQERHRKRDREEERERERG